nr:MAG TPA: hypothetical protein [Caudoviricetes sp.]
MSPSSRFWLFTLSIKRVHISFHAESLFFNLLFEES